MDKRGELQSTLRIEDVPTVRSMVAQKLREAIMSGTLKPGQRLIERELCEMTGVSRPSIREALRLLEADGLVNTVPHRGPVVSTGGSWASDVHVLFLLYRRDHCVRVQLRLR